MRKSFVTLSAALFASSPVLAKQECVGQGAGSCQFVIVATQGPLDDAYFAVDIYSHTCDRIGEATEVDPGQAIDSQLPYTVDIITRGGAGSDTYATFKYAGGVYGRGKTSFVTGGCSSGLDACHWMRSAFPCPGF